MNTYIIHKKINTPIRPFREMELMGYKLFLLADPVAQGPAEGFVISKEISATDGNKAYIDFVVGLVPILDAMSVITQCVIHSLASSSYFIYRVNENSNETLFFYYGGEGVTVGMGLDLEEANDIEKICLTTRENNKERVAFTYLREANYAHTPTAFIAMLIIASEALAGEGKTQGNCKSCNTLYEYPSADKNMLKSIMGQELYEGIYGNRFRHKLFHGGKIDEVQASDLAAKLYEKIVLEYLPRRFGLKSIRKIVNAPRSFSYEYFGAFIKNIGGGVPNIVELEKNHERLISIDQIKDY